MAGLLRAGTSERGGTNVAVAVAAAALAAAAVAIVATLRSPEGRPPAAIDGAALDRTRPEPQSPPEAPPLPPSPPTHAPAEATLAPVPERSAAAPAPLTPAARAAREAERRERAEALVSHLQGKAPASTLEWIRDQVEPLEGIDESVARVAVASLPADDPLVQSFLLAEVAGRDETPEVLRYEVAQRLGREALAETLPALAEALHDAQRRGLAWSVLQGLASNALPEARALLERVASSHADPALRRFAEASLGSHAPVARDSRYE